MRALSIRKRRINGLRLQASHLNGLTPKRRFVVNNIQKKIAALQTMARMVTICIDLSLEWCA